MQCDADYGGIKTTLLALKGAELYPALQGEESHYTIRAAENYRADLEKKEKLFFGYVTPQTPLRKYVLPDELSPFTRGGREAAPTVRTAQMILYRPGFLRTPEYIGAQLKNNEAALYTAGNYLFISTKWDTVYLETYDYLV
jgi:hypothetical protein